MRLQREAEAVLATWRVIESALEAAEPGSAEFERLVTDAAFLRDEYQRLVDETKAEQRSLAEGWPN